MGGPPRVDADVTFLELQDDALRATNGSTATTSEARTRVKAAINHHQPELLTRPLGLRLLRDRQLTFTTAATVHTYSFPSSVARIHQPILGEVALSDFKHDAEQHQRQGRGDSCIAEPEQQYRPRR